MKNEISASIRYLIYQNGVGDDVVRCAIERAAAAHPEVPIADIVAVAAEEVEEWEELGERLRAEELADEAFKARAAPARRRRRRLV